MPLPKTMKGCMHKVSKEYPDGRAKKKMSKKKAHKQHVAMCLNATESVHDMTFTDFLLMEMATGAKIELDAFSGEDGAKIIDVLEKDGIKYTKKGPVITIDMNRNSLAGAALVSHLTRMKAKFEDLSDIDSTNWSFKEGKEEMCSTKCCGKPVSKCHCGPECPHCDCHAKNKLNEGQQDSSKTREGPLGPENVFVKGDTVKIAKKGNDFDGKTGKVVSIHTATRGYPADKPAILYGVKIGGKGQPQFFNGRQLESDNA